MKSFENTSIEKIIVHKIGNKLKEGTVRFSQKALDLSDGVEKALSIYFLQAFRSEELFRFYHDSGLELNEIYTFVSRIFANPADFHEQSIHIGKHLFEKSDHPNIKEGELYIVHFRECEIDGVLTDAVGLFKSESRDTYLKVFLDGENYDIESREGINIHKLDKGCLVFNTEQEDGFVVAVVDNNGKGADAKYWFDDFLHVRQRQDKYFNTEHVLAMTKNFVMKELPNEFEVTKADQAEILNKSIQYFKEKEEFDIQEFAQQVIEQPEVIQSFTNFRTEYQQERDIEFTDNFEISGSAVKKQSRAFKSVIKLDKNFHIYVHGNNQYIKKGYDEETGMHFYQLFFKEEQ